MIPSDTQGERTRGRGTEKAWKTRERGGKKNKGRRDWQKGADRAK
jgi:hypothetical protein